VAAWAQLVLLARERGDLESALERARQLLKLAPRDGAASRLLAETLLAAGDPAGAEAEWRKGLAAAPRAGWLRFSFARFLHGAGREAEARAELDRLLADERLPEDLRAAAEALGGEARNPSPRPESSGQPPQPLRR
jgi:predicted Zn-dependent protease